MMSRLHISAHIALAIVLSISNPVEISQSPDGLRAERQTKVSTQENDGIWQLSNMPYQEEHSSPYLQFIDEREGWVAIGRKLWRTEDEGRHWECIFDRGVEEHGMSNFIRRFQFIDLHVGWIRLFDEMFKTEDGGRTWKPFPQPIHSLLTRSQRKGHLRTFEFLEGGKRGWIGGGVYRPLEEEEGGANRFLWYENGKEQGLFAAVFYTEDGGKSWKEQTVTRSIGDIANFYFLNAEHGWATGQAGIFYLKDGKWKATESDSLDEETGEYVIKSLEIAIGAPTFCPGEVFFLNSQSGWMSNSNGYIGRSTDGGKTWNDILNPRDVWAENQRYPYQGFHRLSFSDLMNGWALDHNGDLHRTIDGGLTWIKWITGLDLTDIQFFNNRLALGVSKQGLYRISL